MKDRDLDVQAATAELKQRLLNALKAEDSHSALKAYVCTHTGLYEWKKEEEREKLRLEEEQKMLQKKLEEARRKNKKEFNMFASFSSGLRSHLDTSKKQIDDKKSLHTGNDAETQCSTCPCPFPCPPMGRKSQLFDSSSSSSSASSCSSASYSSSIDDKRENYTEEEQKEEVKSNHFFSNPSKNPGMLELKYHPSSCLTLDELDESNYFHNNTSSKKKKKIIKKKSMRHALSIQFFNQKFLQDDELDNANNSRRDKKLDSISPLDEDIHKTTLLHEAARLGSLEFVTALLARGGDLNERDSFRRTSLHLVCGGFTALEQYIYDFKYKSEKELDEDDTENVEDVGIRLNIKPTNLGGTQDKNKNGVLSLVRNLFNHNQKRKDNSKSKFHDASSMSTSIQTLKEIEKLRAKYANQRMSILMSIMNSSTQIPSINSVDKRGRTALHYCAELGREDMCSFLLGYDDVILTIIDENGRTPCELASMRGHHKLAAKLEAKTLLGGSEDMMILAGWGELKQDSTENTQSNNMDITGNALVTPFSWFETLIDVNDVRNKIISDTMSAINSTIHETSINKNKNTRQIASDTCIIVQEKQINALEDLKSKEPGETVLQENNNDVMNRVEEQKSGSNNISGQCDAQIEEQSKDTDNTSIQYTLLEDEDENVVSVKCELDNNDTNIIPMHDDTHRDEPLSITTIMDDLEQKVNDTSNTTGLYNNKKNENEENDYGGRQEVHCEDYSNDLAPHTNQNDTQEVHHAYHDDEKENKDLITHNTSNKTPMSTPVSNKIETYESSNLLSHVNSDKIQDGAPVTSYLETNDTRNVLVVPMKSNQSHEITSSLSNFEASDTCNNLAHLKSDKSQDITPIPSNIETMNADLQNDDADLLDKKSNDMDLHTFQPRKMNANQISQLLTHHKWDAKLAIETFREKPLDALNDANISPLQSITKTEPSASQEEVCLICCDEYNISSPDWIQLHNCEHSFCLDCLSRYIESCADANNMGILSIPCPHHNCSVVLNEDEVETFSGSTNSDTIKKLTQVENDNFVSNSYDYSFCPSPGCNGIVHCQVPPAMKKKYGRECIDFIGAVCTICPKNETSTIRTYEGVWDANYFSEKNPPQKAHRFCFSCKKDQHWPISCDMLEQWRAKIREEVQDLDDEKYEDIAQSLWIRANTRPCPKCNVPIEKNEGCNHITCTNKSCKHEFCWICRKDWKLHNTKTGGYFRCNIWQEDDGKNEKIEAMPGNELGIRFMGQDENDVNDEFRYGTAIYTTRLARKKNRAMARFLHHYSRWSAHKDSAALEREMQASVCARLHIVVDAANEYEEFKPSKTLGNGLSFVHAAFTELLECRSMLQHTYPFAFYRYHKHSPKLYRFNSFLQNEKINFEYLQSELEMLTEQMSDIVARKHLRATMTQIMFLTSATAEKRIELNMLMMGMASEQRRKAEEKKKRSNKPSLVALASSYSRDDDCGSDDSEALLDMFTRGLMSYQHYRGEEPMRGSDTGWDTQEGDDVSSENSSNANFMQRQDEDDNNDDTAFQMAVEASIRSHRAYTNVILDEVSSDEDDNTYGWNCTTCTYANRGGRRCAMCGSLFQ